MSKDEKGRRWDGKSRIPTKQYKDNYNEIFKKKKPIPQNNSKPNGSPKKPSLGTNLQINAEIVNGTCPHCREKTVLVSLWTNYIFRCMTCGNDVKQKVNGKIIYIPHIEDPKTFRYDHQKIDTTNG